jgi:hypothetical protein
VLPPLEYSWSLEFQLGLNGMPYLSQVFSCKTKTSLVVSLSIMICNFSFNMYILVSLEWVRSLCWSCFWQTCVIDLQGNWELRELPILQNWKVYPFYMFKISFTSLKYSFMLVLSSLFMVMFFQHQ